jgi:hypothetical protein
MRRYRIGAHELAMLRERSAEVVGLRCAIPTYGLLNFELAIRFKLTPDSAALIARSR